MRHHIGKHFQALTLVLISCLSLQAQPAGWMKLAAGSNDEYAHDIVHDIFGNIYITGQFTGTTDFDPGPGVANLTASLSLDIYILKLDAEGNFIWAKRIGNFSYDDAGFGLTLDNEGNVYVTGLFRGIVDFDPGAGVYNLSSVDYDDGFLLKLDASGNFQWAKAFTGTGLIKERTIVLIGPDHSIYLGGDFYSTIDFDPGVLTHNLTAPGVICDIFLAHYDANGNYLWAHNFGGDDQDYLNSIYVDAAGALYATGQFAQTADFDPGAGVVLYTSAGSEDIFILKLNSDGSFVWVKTMGESDYDGSSSIRFDESGNFYVSGEFRNTIDINPGAGVLNLTSAGDFDMYITKFNSAGVLQWAGQIGGPGYDVVSAMDIDTAGNLYVTGNFNGTIDVDPGIGIVNVSQTPGYISSIIEKINSAGALVWTSTLEGLYDVYPWDITVTGSDVITTGVFNNELIAQYGPNAYSLTGVSNNDVFVYKLSQDLCSNMALSIDSAYDVNCVSGNGYAAAHVATGLPPIDYAWNTIPVTSDSILLVTDPGIYTLQATDQAGCSRTTSVVLDGPFSLTEYDVDITMVSTGYRPGFASTIWLNTFNNGCSPATGYIQLILDTTLIYNSAIPIPDAIDGDTLTWNYENLIFDSLNKAPVVHVTTPVTALLGDIITLQATSVAPADVDTTNNSVQIDQNIVNSYDPNDIQVSPTGVCDAGYIAPDQTLTYTIRFQNTGTADAVNIYLLDTLSANLDPATLDVKSSSHYMITEILPGNILKFNFPNIYLPDSTTDEPESHGYVVYEIDPIAPVLTGSIIENSAGIYFDYNYPVYTNTVINTITDDVPTYVYTQTISICEGDSVMVGDHSYKTSGTYIDILPGEFGCDSTVTTHLTVHAGFSAVQDVSICEGENWMVGDSIYTVSGTYINHFLNMTGCDSTITTELIVLPGAFTALDTSICEGEVIDFNGELLNAAGIYYDTLSNITGCDSVITLTLLVNSINVFVSSTDSTLMAEEADAAYQWIDCSNGNSLVEGATAQIFAPEHSGNYAVIIDHNDCTDTSDCYLIDITSVVNNDEYANVNVFPNPAQTFIIISGSFTTSQPVYIKIFNSDGAIIYRQPVQLYSGNWRMEIPIDQSWAAGLYAVSIDIDGNMTQKKIVIGK